MSTTKTTTALAYFEASQEFLTWINPDDFQDAMLDLVHSAVMASDEMGFDSDKLSNLMFLYRRTTEFVNTISKISQLTEQQSSN